jgi:hypothetical protein
MRSTENFRRQHKELAGIATALESISEPTTSRHLLSELAGKLQMHAAMEEQALYPRLLADARPEVALVAQRLREEYGGVYKTVDAFIRRWRPAGVIETAPDAFADETKTIVAALRQRIDVEERELYTAADG